MDFENQVGEYKSEIKQLRQELESNKQTIYEYKQKQEISSALTNDYIEEIERLNRETKKIQQSFETKIDELSKEKGNILNDKNEAISQLQKQLEMCMSENNEMKNQILDLNKAQSARIESHADRESDVEKLNSRIKQLQELLEASQLSQSELETKYEEIEHKLQLLTEETNNLQISLEFKKEEIVQKNEMIESMQEDLVFAKTEIECMKNKPLEENSRGNSLFAEVNDSRLELMKKIKVLSQKYTLALNEKENLLREIRLLKKEKSTFKQLYEVGMRKYSPWGEIEKNSYNSSICTLNETIKCLERELNILKDEQYSNVPRDLAYYEAVLKRQDEEIKTLRDSMKTYSFNCIMKSKNISDLGTEVISCKSKILELENQVFVLEMKLKTFEDLPKEESKPVTVNIKQDVPEEKEENKENKMVIISEPLKPKRTVQFSDDTKKEDAIVADKVVKKEATVVVRKHMPPSFYAKKN